MIGGYANTLINKGFFIRAMEEGRPQHAGFAGAAANLAALYPPLTIKRHLIIMRVSAPSRTAIAAAPGAARRVSSGGFSVGGSEAPQTTSAAVALRTLGGIDALIALQGVEDPVERRRRAVKHGRRALDALDELKLGLLAGTLDQSTMLRLKAVAVDLHDGSGDERIDQVLAEIDLRVAVELAKAGLA
jgi:Class II flagellar assembly regulator